MKFSQTVLLLNAVMFLLVGFAYLAFPVFFSELLMGVRPPTTTALIEMRATYGGLSLGVGLVLGGMARRTETVRAGLAASLVVLGSVLLGRVVGIMADGSPNWQTVFILLTESGYFGVIVVALVVWRGKEAHSEA